MVRAEKKTVDAFLKLTSSNELSWRIIQKVRTMSCLEEIVMDEINTKDLLGWMEEMI